MRRWLKIYMRQHVARMPMVRARKIQQTLAAAYAFIAMNALAIVYYIKWSAQNPSTEEDKNNSAQYSARILKLENPQIIKLEGFKVVDNYRYEYNLDEKQNEETKE